MKETEKKETVKKETEKRKLKVQCIMGNIKTYW